MLLPVSLKNTKVRELFLNPHIILCGREKSIDIIIMLPMMSINFGKQRDLLYGACLLCQVLNFQN